MKIVFYIIIILVALILGSSVYMAFSSRSNPPALGITNNQFAACPDSPNCVSSDAEGPDHGFPTLALTADAEWSAIVAQVKQTDGVTVTEESADYLRAEARTPLFGYVDDLELHHRSGQLALRSSSRVGHSDMGANRKRLTDLQDRLKAEGLIQ
ncbi:MAG: DUF1499 domain-containing protein [Pseudomonadota bacterium]